MKEWLTDYIFWKWFSTIFTHKVYLFICLFIFIKECDSICLFSFSENFWWWGPLDVYKGAVCSSVIYRQRFHILTNQILLFIMSFRMQYNVEFNRKIFMISFECLIKILIQCVKRCCMITKWFARQRITANYVWGIWRLVAYFNHHLNAFIE